MNTISRIKISVFVGVVLCLSLGVFLATINEPAKLFAGSPPQQTAAPTAIPTGSAPASTPVATQGDGNASVRAVIGLNLRECPRLTCAKLALMPYGTVVAVLDQTSDQAWTQVNYGGKIGWSASLWLTFGGDLTTDTPSGELGAGVELRAVGNVLIRSCPSLRCGSLTLVPWGASVIAYGTTENGLWLMVGYQHPTRGPIIGWSSIGWYANEDFTYPLPELPIIE